MSDLNDLLNGDELPEIDPEEQETTGDNTPEPEDESKPEQEDSTPESEETPEEAEADASKPESKDEDGNWTKAAVLDERRKRQELERQLEQALKDKTPEEKKDWFDDPEGAASQIKQEFQSQLANTRIEMSQEFMRSLHEDYDQLEAEFVDLAKGNPAMLAEFQQSKNPAKFAYETAKKHREYADLKDVDKAKAKLREEVRAELEKEYQQKSEKEQKKREAIPPSLSNQGKGGLSADDYSGPTPLEDILKK